MRGLGLQEWIRTNGLSLLNRLRHAASNLQPSFLFQLNQPNLCERQQGHLGEVHDPPIFELERWPQFRQSSPIQWKPRRNVSRHFK